MTPSRYSYGWRPQTPDPRDYRLQALAPYTGAFVDLTDGFPEVPYDQKALGSCVSNGTAGVLDFARVKQGLAPVNRPARLFIYWFGRKDSRQPIGEDTGLEVRDGLKAVATHGAPPEDTDWPYDVATFAQAPSAQAIADAKLDEAVAYGQVDQSQIDAAIAAGYPVVFGFTVYESFEGDELAKTGIMPIPDKSKEQNLGGHCVVAVSTQIDGAQIGGVAGRKYRKVRNSWGTDWGQGGYFYMPIAVMDGSDADDFWTLTHVSDPNGPTPPAGDPDQVFAAILKPWLKKHHYLSCRAIADAAKIWLAQKGL